jgi:hypothetical protein
VTWFWTMLILQPFNAYAWFLVGRRVERGKREAEADRLEEAAHQRGIRGTVTLSSMKIRR